MEISRTLLFLISTLCFSFLTFIPKTQADPNFLFIDCKNETTYAPNSTYASNLRTLLSALSSNANRSSVGFNSSAAGRSAPDVAYGLFLCQGDLSAAVCRDLVAFASRDVLDRCPSSKRATIWYDGCMLRYSNQSIFSVPDQSIALALYNTQNATDENSFNSILGEVMDDISTQASSGGSDLKFAVREANVSALQKLYGLAQCTPDLTGTDCYSCLRAGISYFPTCCGGKVGARVLYPSCVVHYESYPFFNATAIASPPPPVVLPPPSPPPSTTASSPGKGGIAKQVTVAIVAPIGVAVLFFIAGLYFLSRRAKKRYNTIQGDTVGDDISAIQSLQFDLGAIQAATNNFSNDNKIGEGGFGPVYKGLLPDGQEVAVKRLSRTSGQGAEEFKNEVVLVAKLQHRNLVRLLGFCLEGEEKILVYEYVPNKSLDYILFDPQEREKLDWTRRYKIIGGIARGMLFLHEGSQLRIIHRDLKASKILLDGDMNAKISDFCTARIFGVDQTQGNTSRVVGTVGYMPPEYAMHGRFSAKSDMYSFGVLILKIITGNKNSSFYATCSIEGLLSYAWRLWREGKPLDMMDQSLEASYSRNEVNRCIHIALLCVQEDPDARPTMANVVSMLNSHSATISLPQQPASFSRRGIFYSFQLWVGRKLCVKFC